MTARPDFSRIKVLFAIERETTLRLLAVALLALFWTSILIPSASAIAIAESERRQTEAFNQAPGKAKEHIKPPQEGVADTKPDNFKSPSAIAEAPSSHAPAADYAPSVDSPIPGLPPLVKRQAGDALARSQALQAPVTSKGQAKKEEIISKRTANTTTYRNKDGSYTTRRYYAPQFYKKDNKWEPIDTTLVEDRNAGDSGNVFGRGLGFVQSWFKEETTFAVKENDWQARFAPSGDKEGMVRIVSGRDEVRFSAAGARDSVRPVITTDLNGKQTVHYYDLWPGVDVEYAVLAAELKENIVIKNKNSAADFGFSVSGGSLEKTVPGKDGSYGYVIKGVMNDDLAIAPLAISLNKYGFEARQPLTQQLDGNRLSVSVNRDFLRGLPDDAYPVVLDPTTVLQSRFGSRAGGNYVSFKSDGYVCDSTICNPLAGSVLDSQGVWRSWRGMIHSDYSFVKGKQLNNATLHLTQRLGLSTSGTTAVKNFKTWHAGCFDYNCIGVAGNTSAIGTVGDIDVTGLYQLFMNSNDWGAWLMITGEETNSTTYKNWDPDNSFVQFTFTDILPSPTITSPVVDNQVYIDPQVSFSSTTHTNPASGATLQYVFCVSTSPGCGGTVMSSSPQVSAQWTIPDGLLQDGTTYYVQAQSYDPNIQVYSAWGVPKIFKIDSRTGKDKTQAYDELGPVSIDLATGNMTTSASSHSTNALGGSMGITLDYNSPVRSRNGLVAKYWNLPSGSSDNSVPSGNPAMTRVDQTVNFDWASGSPATGVIANDWFFGQWTGYFVAPTTGTYYFGGKNDDLLRITLNGQELYLSGGCYSGPCWGANGVNLQAGQAVTIDIQYKEVTSPAYAQVWVKGAVTEQLLKTEWLQTGAREVSQQYGLMGSYRKDSGNHDFTDTTANPVRMQRVDQSISFDWGSYTPVSGESADNFMVRWTGYVTAPVSGSYEFGTTSDDGSRITLGNSDTVVLNKWNDDAGNTVWGSAFNLTANVPTRITVDYFEHGGDAKMFLKMRSSGAGFGEQIVPSDWLSYASRPLPAGWNMGIDMDGNISYDHLRVSGGSIILMDSTGSTHEYTWDVTKNNYKPPVNEDGQLIRNPDATFTLQDSDGRTYIFAADGTIKSVTNPTDDTKPAALKYEYGGSPSRLRQITDGVNSSRWMKLYYTGDGLSGCPPTPPSGYANAPNGMLCGAATSDGRSTSFFYANGKLARITEPGNELTDYGYDSLGRITSIRDTLASDAVGAGVRADDATARTEIIYDGIGRVTGVTQPAPMPGATRTQHTLAYFPGTGAYFGATEQHITDANEPNGFSRRVEYDNLLRTTRDTDIANLSDLTVWDPYKDLVLSTTDETGLMSTTIYDDEDRPISNYGPAPTAWYGADRKPTSTYVNQVPRTDTAFDEGMQGPSVAYYAYNPDSQTLTGEPKLHTTNLSGAPAGQFNKAYTASPLPGPTPPTDWGIRATGQMRLPATGNYNFRLYSDGGVKLYIDDKLELSDWNNGGARSHPDISFNNTVAGSVHRFKVEYYHRNADTTTGTIQLYMTSPGGSETLNVNQYISPDYSLTTTTKAYDATLGNTVTTTNYGANPELGQAQSSSVDPTGLNLTTTNTFEAQGAGGSFMRQTSKTLPGGGTTNYAYYTATETRDDPCTTGVTEAYKQAGFLKLKTEADPDGAGVQTGRKTETVYDDAGRVVATRYNTDSWTCTTYDARGRVSSTVIPAFNGNAARTVQNDYAVGGNPLVTTTWDANGWIVVWSDLLGRTTKYRDVYDDETTSTYDNFGKLTQRVSPMGTETYVYDNLSRLTEQKLDGVTYATVSYDAYSRIDHVDYNNAGQMRLTLGRDTLGRTSTMTYRMGDGTTTISDTVNRTQSGQITSNIVQSGANQLWYNFGYDGADRLTSANIGPHTYTYSFGPQNTTACGTGNNKNANSGKNSNRTSQTINGVTTYFCYDYADRLIGSSNPLYNGAQYDTHGNMTQLGTNPAPLTLGYDSSDRSWGFEQIDSATGNGTALYYDRDVQGRIIGRYPNTITGWNWSQTANYFYHYTGAGDTPDYTRNAAWNIVEKTLQLPGGVLATIKPLEAGNNQKQYSLPNNHGDTLLTANTAGTNTSTGNGPANSFTYDPFGSPLPGSTLPTNTAAGSYAWVGQHEKLTETTFTLTPISMGARIYIPQLGRFTQVDPIEGGNDNLYTYPTDPVGEFDLTGEWPSFKSVVKAVAKIATVASFVPGPVGIIGGAVGVATNLVTGNMAGAALAATGMVPGGRAVASIASKSKVGTRLLTKGINSQARAKIIGTNSKLFGTHGKGILNKGKYRVGWARDKGHIAWRIGRPGSHNHIVHIRTSIKWKNFK